MTATNGEAPTLPELREQLKLVRVRVRLAQAERGLALAEGAGDAQFGAGYADWLNPWQFRLDPFGNAWLPLGLGGPSGRRDGRNAPFVQSDADLDRMRGLSRWLCTKNDLAIGIVDNLCNFTVKKGYDWDTRPVEGYEEDGRAIDLARQVKAVIRHHDQLNNAKRRERSFFKRSVRDGDATMRHFAQADGMTLLRFVAAEQLRDPGDLGPHCSFGVETDPEDVETPLAYHVTYDGAGTYERVPASDVTHFKRNVDEEVKRGLSDFYSAGDTLEEVGKLLRNMRKGGALLAAIAWIEEFETATRDQMGAHQGGLKDLNRPQTDHPLTGRPITYEHYEPGTKIRVNKGKKFIPPPLAGNTTNFTSIIQACLRTAGVRWSLPEYMTSGDASNANMASLLVSGSPLVNAIECQQDDFAAPFLRWRWIAVKNACDAGVIRASFEEVQALVEIHHTAPLVAISNEAEQAQIDHGDMDRGVLSVPTRQARRKLDAQQEKKNIAQSPQTRVPGRATDLDAQGNPVNVDTGGVSDGGAAPRPDADALRLMQAVTALQTAAHAGAISRADAVANLVGTLGMDRPRAEALFPPVAPVKTADDGRTPAPLPESLLHEARREGEVWQGPSKRWFTLKGGHVVPAVAPGGGGATAAAGAGDAAGGDDPKLAKMGLIARLRAAAAEIGLIAPPTAQGPRFKEVSKLSPADRLDNSPPREEFVKKLQANKNHQASWEAYAAAKGQDVETARKEAGAKIDKMIEPLKPAVRVDLLNRDDPSSPDLRIINAILDDGQFKNQFHEGVSSKRALNGRKIRAGAEEKSMGVPADAPADSRPVYGYLAPGKPSRRDEKANAYGGLVVNLKPSVKGRSTVSMGDSLMGGINGEFAAGVPGEMTADTIHPAALARHGDEVLTNPLAFDDKVGYIEIHVHDGLPTSDIESVEWPKSDYGPMPDSLKERLAKQNIPWSEY